MSGNVLVDTSAWIVSFRKNGLEPLKRAVVDALNSLSAVTSNIIILELLQGCRDKKEYDALSSRFSALEVLPLDEKVWETAFAAGYELRRKGITVSTVDIVIASLAKAHGCSLLHHDKHFRLIAKHLQVPAVDFIGE